MNYAILVNTTDSFEDCWIPFFTLFKKYWPDYKGKIYLNTEKKDFIFKGLDIVCVKNSRHSKTSLKWGECLLRALDFISEDIVLYLQEDYFFNAPVLTEIVNQFVSTIENSEIGCIHLTDQATSGPFHRTEFSDLFEIDRKAPYRISTQAALWEKEVLKKYVLPFESGWLFEQFGTKRAYIQYNKLFIVDTSKYGCNKIEIIPYIFTGIIKGKWNIDTPELFLKNNINIDFSLRGFFKSDTKKGFAKKISNRIKMIPSYLFYFKLKLWGK